MGSEFHCQAKDDSSITETSHYMTRRWRKLLSNKNEDDLHRGRGGVGTYKEREVHKLLIWSPVQMTLIPNRSLCFWGGVEDFYKGKSCVYKLFNLIVLRLVTWSCPTLCDPMDCNLPGSSVHGDSPDKNTRVHCHALLQGIFPTHGSNPGLPHCR